MNRSHMKLLAASLMLALGLPAAAVAAEDISGNTRFDLSSVQESATYDRFVVVYRNGSTERGSSAAAVVGMAESEGYALIARLRAWMTQPRYVYRHEWRMGDVLMWDNTGTLHRVLPFDRTSDRRLHRVTLIGEEPITDTPHREAA